MGLPRRKSAFRVTLRLGPSGSPRYSGSAIVGAYLLRDRPLGTSIATLSFIGPVTRHG